MGADSARRWTIVSSFGLNVVRPASASDAYAALTAWKFPLGIALRIAALAANSYTATALTSARL